MHRQRLVLLLAACAGVLSALMPWQTLVLLSQSGLDLGLAQAWPVFALFGAALVVSLLGKGAQPLAGPGRAAAALLGAGGAAFGVWKLLAVRDGALGMPGVLDDVTPADAPPGAGRLAAELMQVMIEPGEGLYVMIAAGAVVAITALYRGRRSTLLPRGPYAD